MLSNLLALGSDAVMLIVCIVAIGGLILWMFLGSRKRKKQEQDAQNLINAVGPGNKVKTIGGICGIVVEVDKEENTFILETGSETTGKCYIKFDKQAIYQTDAAVETGNKSEGSSEQSATETPVAEAREEAPAENTTETKE